MPVRPSRLANENKYVKIVRIGRIGAMDHLEQEGGQAGAPRRGDPAALALLAMGTQHDPATAKDLRHYLRAQSSLAEIQAEEVRHEWHLRYGSVRVRYWSDILHLAFNVSIAFIALIAAVIVGALIWTAASQNGLVVEALAVPPDMAQRGLSGQAVASQLLDKILDLDAASASTRPASSFSNNWGDDIKIEIPQTGVSIGEARRMMITWLGHETHITGEVYRTPSGLAIATRATGAGGSVVSGAEADLGNLLQQAAETIFAETQPYRYSVYLMRHGKFAEAQGVLQKLAAKGDTARERAWANLGLGMIANSHGDWYGGAELHRRAAALFPNFALAWIDIDTEEFTLSHPEHALAAARTAVRLLESGRDIDMIERAQPIALLSERADVARGLADFGAALTTSEQGIKLPDHQSSDENAREAIAVDLARLHDRPAALNAWRMLPPSDDAAVKANRALTRFALAYWFGDCGALLAHLDVLGATLSAAEKNPDDVGLSFTVMRARVVRPYAAYARAVTGDFKGAHALIDLTPLDCDACLRGRGLVFTAQRNWPAAAYWFARAVEFSPSIPLAYVDWGRMLLAKGDVDGAIAKFSLAAARAPHFADPLELWGEALMAKNRSDLALAKFQQAAKYAPHWGRLHLKWGEALVWLRRKNDGRVEFEKAARLDLSPAEHRQLASFR
jgi:tetratricopeptide (TPR) repeat protein